jgi:hypothetical protein
VPATKKDEPIVVSVGLGPVGSVLEISGRSAYEYPVATANLGAGIAVRLW